MNYTCIRCGKPFEAKHKTAVCKNCHTAVCVVCGKEFELKSPWTQLTCSTKCKGIYRKQSGISKQASLKAKKTMLERYGVEHALQSNEFLERSKATLKSNYGVDNPMKSDEIKMRVQETCLDKYSVDNPSKSSKIVAQIRKSFQYKYGVDNAMKVDEFRQAQRKSTKQSIGYDYALKSEEVRDKVKATNLARYGYEYVSQVPCIKDKIRKTNSDKYGVEYISQSSEIQDKIQSTCMKKYGVPFNCMTPQCRSSYRTISKINQSFMDMLDANNIQYSTEFPISRRSFDFKIGNILVEIDPTITHNAFMSIFPDIDPLSLTYHTDKTKLAEENGYRCIHVWDWDDWDAIISLVKPKEAVYVRKCTVAKVDKQTADKFTAKHHISGKCNGQKENYGLYYKEELIQVMTFGKPRYNKKYDWELLRLCSKSNLKVLGGASRLFAAYLAEHEDESVISYCDLSKFNGSVYEKIGMELSHVTSPAKIWSKGNKKITDNLLRQRGYDQLFGTCYGKGTSNEQLMLDNGWLPIYDCGQNVYHYIPKCNLV